MISHLRCRVEASYSEMLHKLQYYLIPILRLPKSLNENISYIVMTVNHMRYPQKTVAVGRGKTWKSLCRDSQNCNASEPGMERYAQHSSYTYIVLAIAPSLRQRDCDVTWHTAKQEVTDADADADETNG